MAKERRKTIKVDSTTSKVINELLDGNIVRIEDGSLSKKVLWKLRDIKKKGVLKNSYSQDERCSYLWFTEEISRENLIKNTTKSGVFGDIWEMITSLGELKGPKKPKKQTFGSIKVFREDKKE